MEGAQRLGDGILDGITIVGLGLDAGYEQIARLMDLCSQYGWCLTPDASLLVIFAAVKRVNPSSRPHHELYRVLRDHFMAEDWLELERLVFAMMATKPKRRKILSDCIVTLRMHRKRIDGRRFNAANLIVPTCVAVVEGMLYDFARQLGISGWSKSRFDRLREEILSVSFAFDKPAIDLIFDILFSPADADKDVAESGLRFSRHKIMHGNWLEYGKIENVIRLFLLARFLITSLRSTGKESRRELIYR